MSASISDSLCHLEKSRLMLYSGSQQQSEQESVNWGNFFLSGLILKICFHYLFSAFTLFRKSEKIIPQTSVKTFPAKFNLTHIMLFSSSSSDAILQNAQKRLMEAFSTYCLEWLKLLMSHRMTLYAQYTVRLKVMRLIRFYFRTANDEYFVKKQTKTN